MIRAIAALMLAGLMAEAQTGPPVSNGSISGVVRDAASKAPVENVIVTTYVGATWSNGVVTMSKDTREVAFTTDSQGKYSLKDLPPGPYSVTARKAQGGGFAATRMVTLAPARDLTLDIEVTMPGTITGRVFDDNKEPMPDAEILLVSTEYYFGQLKHFLKGLARTDDQGQYTLERVEAGTPFRIMARRRGQQRLPAISDLPVNPKLRLRAFAPTFYPNSLAVEGGQQMTLRSSERKEGIDIVVQRTPSFCAEGATSPPMAAQVELVEDQPSTGVSAGGGMFMVTPSAKTAADGKFRFCGLHPGVYRVTSLVPPSTRDKGPAQFGVMTFVVRDEDVTGLKAPVSSGATLKGEFAWDGATPDIKEPPVATFSLAHLYRAQYAGETLYARGPVPSGFTIENLNMDEYSVRCFFNAPGGYVKDVTYGTNSVMYTPLRLGSALGDAGVKVLLALDGGGAAVTVTRDGQPAGGAKIYLFPKEVRSEGELQARIFSCNADQDGACQTGLKLAPGSYQAVALRTELDATPEMLGKVLRVRSKAADVQITPGKMTAVTLELLNLE